MAGPYEPLFDPEKYVTGELRRNQKWRINFNGIGSKQYCPTVRLTPVIRDGIASDILGRTKAFLDSLGPTNADRALSWAYLSETDSSFAIEKETPNQNKTGAFVALLQLAHEKLTAQIGGMPKGDTEMTLACALRSFYTKMN